ncbi:MAG: tyrosine-type recombinase/integrase, partial [Bacteroidales bacterium]|nr:tyrosine-type recombinase/integrase [Bacteroidales bacterium]
ESICSNVVNGVGSIRTKKDTFRKMHLESDQGAQLLTEAYLTKKVRGVNAGVTRKLNSNEDIISQRNYAMLNLMLRTGLRTIEVSRADVGDITRKKGRRILRVWGKGHSEKDDFVVLTDEAYLPIRDYLATRPGAAASEPLFCTVGLGHSGKRMSTRTIQSICKEHLRAIGLDGHEYSAHSLRHTTGTQILLNGGTMMDVQNVLRHASPATSQIYVNTIMEDKRLDDASEELLDNSFK